MKILPVIYHAESNEYAMKALASGKSAFYRVMDFIASLGESVTPVLFTGHDCPPDWPFEKRTLEHWSMKDVFDAMSGAWAENPEVDAIVYVRSDCPLLDAKLAVRMLADFRKYRAEYHFADGLPPGFAPEIIRPRILGSLSALCRTDLLPVTREGVFSVLQRDINSFDIETEISTVDLREYRLSPTCDTKRDFMTVGRLEALGVCDAQSAQEIIPAHPEVLRSLPAFIQVQISGGCMQECSSCPYPIFSRYAGSGGNVLDRRDSMSLDSFSRLMDDISRFCDDAVIDVSLWGEASMHPDFAGIVKAALVHPRFTLIVETSGLGWDKALLESLARDWPERLVWIVSLDETEEAAYASLRGKGFQEAQDCAAFLIALFPKTAHVQAVRMQENEKHLESFYRSWKARTDNVIIQKYDPFAGFLPDKAVSDLSPIDRPPCRHLARDLAVLVDGTVPLCRECLVPGAIPDGIILGNAFTESIQTVWEKGEPWFARHAKADYPGVCGRCDEYHTYNA